MEGEDGFGRNIVEFAGFGQRSVGSAVRLRAWAVDLVWKKEGAESGWLHSTKWSCKWLVCDRQCGCGGALVGSGNCLVAKLVQIKCTLGAIAPSRTGTGRQWHMLRWGQEIETSTV